MPSYLYRCDQCGGELELSHSVPSNSDLAPLCCSYPMIRVFSPPAGYKPTNTIEVLKW